MDKLKKLRAQAAKIEQEIVAVEAWEKRKSALVSLLEKSGAAHLTDAEISAALKAALGKKQGAQASQAVA